MNKLQVTIHDKAGRVQYDQLHTAPSDWNEVNRQHLMAWGAALCSGLTFANAMIVFAAILYGIPVRLYKCISKPDANAIAETVHFFFKKNQLNNWLIPSIWCGWFKYYGPKSRLANITVGEFDKLEYCYEQFNNTKNPEYLDTLAAILYRPQRYWNIDQDIRVKLTTHGYVRRAKRFKKLPLALKTAIYLNYEGCRHYLHKRFKDIFEGKKTAGQSDKILTPWPKIIESGSNDIFGPHESTKNTFLHDFLSRLATRIKEMKELEQNNH
jgi:hypothetical protein